MVDCVKKEGYSKFSLEYFTKINPLYIVLALIFHISSLFIWSARMKILAKATGGSVSFLKSFEILLSSLFAACITPSEVGGEPVKIYLLSEENVSFGDATAVVVTERFLDVIFLVLVSPLGLFIFWDLVLTGGLIIIPIIAVAFFITVFSLLLLIMFRPEVLKSIVNLIFGIILRIWRGERIKRIINRINDEIDTFINGMWTLAKKRSEMALASGCTVSRWLIDLCTVPLILIGMGSEPYVVYSFGAQILLVVLLLAPITPGGSGIAEIGSATIFSTFIESVPVGVLVFLHRFVTYHFNLILGAVISALVLKDMKLVRRMLGGV